MVEILKGGSPVSVVLPSYRILDSSVNSLLFLRDLHTGKLRLPGGYQSDRNSKDEWTPAPHKLTHIRATRAYRVALTGFALEEST